MRTHRFTTQRSTDRSRPLGAELPLGTAALQALARASAMGLLFPLPLANSRDGRKHR